jgi:hypothetical protein
MFTRSREDATMFRSERRSRSTLDGVMVRRRSRRPGKTSLRLRGFA